jgi:hypothetical protein
MSPRLEVIRQMGNKACAKDMVKKTKVPIVLGSEGVIENEALKIAESIGFSMIIKAVAQRATDDCAYNTATRRSHHRQDRECWILTAEWRFLEWEANSLKSNKEISLTRIQ